MGMKIKDFITAVFKRNRSESETPIKAHHVEKTSIINTEEKTDINDKHEGCSKVEQKKCTCQSCGNIYYYSDEEISHIANIFVGKFYTSSKMEDFRQCPRCGNYAAKYKNVCFWIDSKGNCIDVEETPCNIIPTSPDTFQSKRHDYGQC
jgi:hypothetical protein